MSPVRPAGGGPDELVTVGRYLDPVEAQLARSRLEADGLACHVQGEGFVSLLPTGTLYPILLQVRAADLPRAAEILAEEPAADPPAESPAAGARGAGEDPGP